MPRFRLIDALTLSILFATAGAVLYTAFQVHGEPAAEGPAYTAANQ